MTQPTYGAFCLMSYMPAHFDFDGAGRFIRFVFLINDAAAVSFYVNAFLETKNVPPIARK